MKWVSDELFTIVRWLGRYSRGRIIVFDDSLSFVWMGKFESGDSSYSLKTRMTLVSIICRKVLNNNQHPRQKKSQSYLKSLKTARCFVAFRRMNGRRLDTLRTRSFVLHTHIRKTGSTLGVQHIVLIVRVTKRLWPLHRDLCSNGFREHVKQTLLAGIKSRRLNLCARYRWLHKSAFYSYLHTGCPKIGMKTAPDTGIVKMLKK